VHILVHMYVVYFLASVQGRSIFLAFLWVEGIKSLAKVTVAAVAHFMQMLSKAAREKERTQSERQREKKKRKEVGGAAQLKTWRSKR